MSARWVVLLLISAVALAVGGCNRSDEAASTAPDSDGARFPDVVEATLTREGDAWALAATVSSPYDSAERYADAFRARTRDGEVLGVRDLTHPHADEQPFTRTLTDLAIPDDVDVLIVEGRDLVNGWGGGTTTVEVPR